MTYRQFYCPDRLRQVPAQYNLINHRLIYELRRLPHRLQTITSGWRRKSKNKKTQKQPVFSYRLFYTTFTPVLTLGLWQQGVRVDSQRQTGTDPPGGDWVYEPIDQDPFPDYDTEPVLFYANA